MLRLQVSDEISSGRLSTQYQARLQEALRLATDELQDCRQALDTILADPPNRIAHKTISNGQVKLTNYTLLYPEDKFYGRSGRCIQVKSRGGPRKASILNECAWERSVWQGKSRIAQNRPHKT